MKRMACVFTAAALGLMPLGACQSSSNSRVSREGEVIENNQGEHARQNISSDTDSEKPADQGNFADPGSLGADE